MYAHFFCTMLTYIGNDLFSRTPKEKTHTRMCKAMILSTQLLQPADIIVDVREATKNSDIVESLKNSDIRVAVVELAAGDYYLIANDENQSLLVERKTVIDLANSIRDNRIWDQARRLKEAAEKDHVKPVILLEGWLGLIEK